jgi:membrane protein YqaA with SNARE-associated domain
MAVEKKLTFAFIIFYLAVIIYLVMFFFIPSFQALIIQSRQNLAKITLGSNYLWALLIALIICFLGDASIGFPVPYPFVLFAISISVYDRYESLLFSLEAVLQHGPYWVEIMSIAAVSALGCALGELAGYLLGFSAKKLANGSNSELLRNVDGFGKLILENEKRTPIYIFLFAMSPLPDDLIFIPLGMIKYPAWKCILPGWLGKIFVTTFYCLWPILIELGIMTTGATSDDFSSVITESIMLLITITVMFFIMSFDWNKLLENRKKKNTE